jgi:CHAT domain
VTGSLAAQVRVSVLPSQEFTRVEFSSIRASVPALTLTLAGKDRLERALEELDSGLLQLKESLPALDARDDELDSAYTALEDLGDALWYTLFGNDETAIHGIQSFWKSAIPFGRNPSFAPLLVECVADTPFPLEYLPLLGSLGATPAASRADLLDRFRSFIGFSCLVQRKTLKSQSAGALKLTADGDGNIPVRYLQYDGLPGAQRELEWFDRLSHRVRVEGPYPDNQCTVTLPQQVFDPRMLLTGGLRDIPDQIQHFSCHCYTKAKTPLDSEIELSGSSRSVRLRLRDIGRELVRLTRHSTPREFDLPLVFLNACGSARMRADGAFSFPQIFLENKNRGFIGTEIEMPDDVASTFSGAFYERFLRWGMPLGWAVLEARRHLLYQHGNPLGIAYTSYADPELYAEATAGGDI